MMMILARYLPRRFKFRIFLLISILGFLTLLINLGVTVSFQRRFIVNNINNSIENRFKMTRKALSEAFLYDDIFNLHGITRSIVDSTLFVDNAYILDNQFRYITDAKVSKTFPFRIPDRTSVKEIDAGEYNLHIRPVAVEGERLGYLVFEVQKQKIRDSVMNQVLNIAIVNSIIVIIGVLLGIRIAVYLTRPLEKLTRSLNTVNLENLPLSLPVGKFVSLEVEQLHQSLESMSIRLLETVGKLYEKEKELARNEKLASIGTMAAGLAHELKNPIMSINLLTYKLKKENKNHELKKDIDIIRQEADRLIQRTNDFLVFARPVSVKRTWQALEFICREITQFTSQRYGKKITLELDVDQKQFIVIDEDKVLQVLFNLVTNAVDAGANRIVLQVFDTLGEVFFILTDNARGFEDKDREKAFMPFFTTKENNTGLGLSICEMILEALGGRIYIESTSTKGTRFVIRWKKEENV